MNNRIKRVAFADKSIFDSFQKLKYGKFEERQLAACVQRAIDDLKENPFAGIAIPRRLWPRDYIKKFSIDNLREYDLPKGWRLIYTVQGNEIEIISIILEWLSHKEYEKRFKYNVK
jgi:Txe/YoeB family toxin of Txe-Axe toxin-antitoxin module